VTSLRDVIVAVVRRAEVVYETSGGDGKRKIQQQMCNIEANIGQASVDR